MKLAQAIAEDFRRQFDHEPLLVRAPGRINLIGEHTDYNAGFVLPAAIDREMAFAVALNNTDTIRLRAFDLQDAFTTTVDQVHRIESADWANYLLGVVAQFRKRGVAVPGFDCVFGGNVPIGAGLSSSAAVECGLAVALDTLLGTGIDKLDLAFMAQKAEHEYALVQCGIMDQFASLFGQEGHVVRLDCRSMAYEYFPFDTRAVRVVLCNSGVKHSLASSEYNTRRQECEQGVAILQKHYAGIETLRDATPAQVNAHRDELGPVLHKRCLYVVEENARVLAACDALAAHDLAGVGQLMYASHIGLRDQYEVSCQELDVLMEVARATPGVYGARMMGGGFGGCTINLVAVEHADAFVEHMTQAYRERLGLKLETYQTTIVGGVSVMA
ncbi:galactokinase [Hymenobacter busanensis]|uniref:Galactokinase n=1 Tax=Hymenobacter busanensis TaxID=2607656 RepID=A0A7L4ZWU8_9BACT|nr:galactokinase [Hymenobacter busanensis]KAA9333342.1 galactokinase [Hymenobacter busanensis]QHJ07979.1 galactokinase [Hymenobacter busanensis]